MHLSNGTDKLQSRSLGGKTSICELTRHELDTVFALFKRLERLKRQHWVPSAGKLI